MYRYVSVINLKTHQSIMKHSYSDVAYAPCRKPPVNYSHDMSTNKYARSHYERDLLPIILDLGLSGFLSNEHNQPICSLIGR